jgi:Cdc6-like AAA superfamily ATPase
MSPAVESDRLAARAGATCTRSTLRRGGCPTLPDARRAARMARRARMIAAQTNHHSTPEVPR